MNIGQAAKASGISMKMVRRYEDEGLLPGVLRSRNGYRLYTDADVTRLRFIKRARMLDFSLRQIRDLLALSDASDRRCLDVLAITQEHARELDAKVEAMKETARRLHALASSCDASDGSDCRIIESLLSGIGLDAASPEVQPSAA